MASETEAKKGQKFVPGRGQIDRTDDLCPAWHTLGILDAGESIRTLDTWSWRGNFVVVRR